MKAFKVLIGATEAIPGAWRGSVEYVIDHTTVRGAVNLVTEPFFEPGHGTNVSVRNLSESKGEGRGRGTMRQKILRCLFLTVKKILQ